MFLSCKLIGMVTLNMIILSTIVKESLKNYLTTQEYIIFLSSLFVFE